MIKILSEKNLKNGHIISIDEIYKVLKNDNIIEIYEVIRIINKKPIFIKEHYERLCKSINILGYEKIYSYNEVLNQINILIESNNIDNKNIRISYLNDKDHSLLLYFIESKYPEEKSYKEGVNTILFNKTRQNPHIKIYEDEVRANIEKIKKERNVFEVLFINENNTISEGSRSNIFFVKDNVIITPKDNKVLLGVTRLKVIEICKNNNMKILRKDVYTNELNDFDGVFITGTSINIMPVSKIDRIKYDSANHEIIKNISLLYFEEIKKR